MFSYLIYIYRKIRSTTPGYVPEAIVKLIPVVLLLSVFDIFGLILILPIIKIIIDPAIIYNNKYLYFLFSSLNIQSEIAFSVCLLSITVLFFVLKNIVTFYGSKWQSNYVFNIAQKLTIHQYELYLLKPFQYHTGKESGNLLRSIIEIPYNFASGILMPFVLIINELIVASIILAFITIYNPILFISVLIFIAPLLFVYTKIHKSRLLKVSDERDSSHTKMFAKGKQALDGFREIILFNKIDYFKNAFQKSVIKFSKAFSTLYLFNAYSPRIVEGIAVISIFGIFLISYFLNYEMTLVASFLAAFSIAAYRLIPSINKIILSYNNIKSSEFVFKHFEKSQIISVKNINAEDISFNTTNKTPLKFSKTLVFKDLTFHYSDSKKNIFDKINLKINKGETIGIIGESGSGKTTLINILLMLLEGSSGSIYLDDIKLDNKTKYEWYNTISYVPQNVIIVSGTIKENITFGIPGEKIDNERLKRIIVQSQLLDFVNSFPNGIDTNIGEHGLKISGGQRQRIGIARALYHGGSILVFDEATSSLDKKTEELLTNSIRELSGNEFTIIIIAHRTESLKYCDFIYRIDNGTITGPLTFNEISEK